MGGVECSRVEMIWDAEHFVYFIVQSDLGHFNVIGRFVLGHKPSTVRDDYMLCPAPRLYEEGE